ncbi:DUF366 family protein [Methanocaldococcus indicus]|uniref:DUF366 family protein n=1 Tax=Methanocaldococcus indicus TaxID=213231 RepID=UPI003C6D0BF3
MKAIDFSYITVVFVDNLDYTGKEIKELWAFETFNIQKDSIVAFRGKMEVKREFMKDLKDLKREKIDMPIVSDDSINFIVEHFDVSLRDIYFRQRLLIFIAKEIIENYGVKLYRDGDDLYYKNKKLSVSIACKGIVSGKIHLGINVKSKKIHVPIVGLEDLGLDANKIMEEIALKYANEIEKIEKDLRKTKPL